MLSGETGAGKSVILDSVNFVLGAKADRTMIRYGETECMVKAEFVVPESSRAVRALREMDIETEGDIIISRRFGESGKNSIKINGCTATAAMLRTVTDHLVDVHGQSEHFFLLKEANQLRTLDGVAGEELAPVKRMLGTLLEELRRTDAQIALIGGDEKERGRRLDVLKFQIEEIESVGLREGEEEELLVRRNKINNLEKIISAFREASEALAGERGALDGLRTARRAVSSVAGLDGAYEAIAERLESLSLEADDVAETLAGLGEELEFDEDEAKETESRLDAIRSLKRKYGADKKEIDAFLAKCKEEFELLSDSEGRYARLTEEKEALGKKIYSVCREMTEIRKRTGEKFCRRVTEELKTLNIAHARFEISFGEYTEADVGRANANGLDEICFLFSANAGGAVKAARKNHQRRRNESVHACGKDAAFGRKRNFDVHFRRNRRGHQRKDGESSGGKVCADREKYSDHSRFSPRADRGDERQGVPHRKKRKRRERHIRTSARSTTRKRRRRSCVCSAGRRTKFLPADTPKNYFVRQRNTNKP